MLIPKKSKYLKQQKGRAFNKISNNTNLHELKVGCAGLKALQPGRLTSKQLLAVRQTLNKLIKKKGKIFINIFPHTPITNKPIKVRMGKGKGNVDHHICKIKPGNVLCEIQSNSLNLAIKALNQAQVKIPFLTKLIKEKDIYA